MISGLVASAAAKLVGLGVGEKFAKPLVYVIGAGILLSVLGLGKCAYDASVIREHDAKVNLKVEGAAREADGVAAGERRDDDSRAAAESGELGKVTDNDPDKNKPATSSQRDYLRCVRLQQQAREAGNPAPTCSRPAD